MQQTHVHLVWYITAGLIKRRKKRQNWNSSQNNSVWVITGLTAQFNNSMLLCKYELLSLETMSCAVKPFQWIFPLLLGTAASSCVIGFWSRWTSVSLGVYKARHTSYICSLYKLNTDLIKKMIAFYLCDIPDGQGQRRAKPNQQTCFPWIPCVWMAWTTWEADLFVS